MFTFIKNKLFGSPPKEEAVVVEQTSQALLDKIMLNFIKYPPSEWTGWHTSGSYFLREDFFLACEPRIPYALYVRKTASKLTEGGVIVGETNIKLDDEHAKLLLQFLVNYKKKEEVDAKDAAWKRILKS